MYAGSIDNPPIFWYVQPSVRTFKGKAMDQEIEKTCRNAYPFDFKTCSGHKQSRTLTRNDKLVSLAFNVFVWAAFFAMASHRPGHGIDLALIAFGLEVALITTLTFHALLVDHRRPQRLAADICRFPQGCRRSGDAEIALADPDTLKLAAEHRCQPEESFAAYEAIRRSQAKADRVGGLVMCGIFVLYCTSLFWWLIRDLSARRIPLTWKEQVARGEQIDTFMLHLLGYGALTAGVISILVYSTHAVNASRKAKAEDKKREKALAALERMPTGYRIAAVRPEDSEEPLECRLARIPHHLHSTEIREYLVSVDPAESGCRTYPTRTCGA